MLNAMFVKHNIRAKERVPLIVDSHRREDNLGSASTNKPKAGIHNAEPNKTRERLSESDLNSKHVLTLKSEETCKNNIFNNGHSFSSKHQRRD